MPILIALVLLVTAVAAPRAEAGGLRIVIGGDTGSHPGALWAFVPPVPAHHHPHAAPPAHGFHPRFHPGRHQHLFVVPHSVVVVPRCYVPGHWAYQWVPQTRTYDVWVPGAWSPDGTWIDGHYRTHYYTTGYYQPYWVDGRPC
jgi:hypothetical protein